MSNILWLQAACCGGETVSLLNADQPDLATFLKTFGIDINFHPSFSHNIADTKRMDLVRKSAADSSPLDILIVEGAIITKPVGHIKPGSEEKPLSGIIRELAQKARYTVAVGTCASFGGVIAAGANRMDACGLQYAGTEFGGFLGRDYKSTEGFPVINVPGCPAHADWIMGTFIAVLKGDLTPEKLDRFNRPKMFYSRLAHHACPRNEFYEFKASANRYGQRGCLFENLGCKATQCESDCNVRLWLSRTGSCPRGGFPCLSCTSPRFPDGFVPFFRTEKIGDIPTSLPLDVPKAWYVGISGLAKLACPERLLREAVSSRDEKDSGSPGGKKNDGKTD
jgi:NiFe hydrogenase small subunit HydA